MPLELIDAKTETPVLDSDTRSQAFFSALQRARKKFTPIPKTAYNSHLSYSYAPLPAVLEGIMPALESENFMVFQPVSVDLENRSLTVTTVIHHLDTGLQMKYPFRSPAFSISDKGERFTPQTIAAAATYTRRQSFLSFFALAAEDDDANSFEEYSRPAARVRPRAPAPAPAKYAPAPPTKPDAVNDNDPVRIERLQQIEELIKKYPDAKKDRIRMAVIRQLTAALPPGRLENAKSDVWKKAIADTENRLPVIASMF